MPYFTSLGWQLVVIALLFILANRFSKARRAAEYLNIHLQDEVNDRTKDWEIAYSFKPMSGVSGDLYDFFTEGSKFNGLALFDVSGHGISSGLVTMLAKDVVVRNFTADMSIKFGNVMKKINDAIVEEKGDIENYLTGLLLRVSGNKVQFINAGHPAVFLRTAANGKCYPVQLLVKEASTSMFGGIIGIPGMEVDFSAVQFNMAAGDALIMYTDCLSESLNKEGEQYSQNKIARSFENSGNGNADSKLKKVLDDFYDYTDNVPLKDDLTVIVLQKK